MEPKAENVVQNVGAIAEAISVFYNSIIRQVPKDVALTLTKHFMDLTIARRPITTSPEARAIALAAAEAQKRMLEQRNKEQETIRHRNEADVPHVQSPESQARGQTGTVSGGAAAPLVQDQQERGQTGTISGGAAAPLRPGTPRPPQPESPMPAREDWEQQEK